MSSAVKPFAKVIAIACQLCNTRSFLRSTCMQFGNGGVSRLGQQWTMLVEITICSQRKPMGQSDKIGAQLGDRNIRSSPCNRKLLLKLQKHVQVYTIF